MASFEDIDYFADVAHLSEAFAFFLSTGEHGVAGHGAVCGRRRDKQIAVCIWFKRYYKAKSLRVSTKGSRQMSGDLRQIYEIFCAYNDTAGAAKLVKGRLELRIIFRGNTKLPGQGLELQRLIIFMREKSEYSFFMDFRHTI